MSYNKNYVPRRLGMIAQISLYLLPASVVLIFLPSCLFTYFEGWPYSVSVYYSFVTLSTIGFGDFIPTFQPHQVITANNMHKCLYTFEHENLTAFVLFYRNAFSAYISSCIRRSLLYGSCLASATF